MTAPLAPPCGKREPMMRERPILFSAPMVTAILEGRKTQTRRVVKFRDVPLEPEHHNVWRTGDDWQDGDDTLTCPYGRPGDRLWVRESYRVMRPHGADEVQYRADWKPLPYDGWKSSIYMPRWASRLTLDVVNVRVERLQDITARDAWQEGVRPAEVPPHAGDGTLDPPDPEGSVLAAFRDLWDRLNAKRGHAWESNPWVWVVEFRRVEP